MDRGCERYVGSVGWAEHTHGEKMGLQAQGVEVQGAQRHRARTLTWGAQRHRATMLVVQRESGEQCSRELDEPHGAVPEGSKCRPWDQSNCIQEAMGSCRT